MTVTYRDIALVNVLYFVFKIMIYYWLIDWLIEWSIDWLIGWVIDLLIIDLSKNKAKMLIVGDSLISNWSRYPEIWRKYFTNHGTLNFGVAGDKGQTIWTVILHLSSNLHLKLIFICCGTSSIDQSSPQSITSTIISTGLEVQKKSHNF